MRAHLRLPCLCLSLCMAACGDTSPQAQGGAAPPPATGAAAGPAATTGAATAPVAPSGLDADGKRTCTLASADASCCDRDFGLDPAGVAKACGFAAYLGEFRTSTSCQLRFDAGRETPAALTVVEFAGLSFDEAIALHMSGFMGANKGDDVPNFGRKGPLHLSGLGKLAWAYVDGWSAPRRVAWSKAECAADKLRPVLESMAEAAESPAAQRKPAPPQTSPRLRPAPTHDGVGPQGSLLDRYADRELKVPEELTLPGHSMRMVIMLLERAAQDTVRGLDKFVAKDARWGLPDRRELRARSILSDGGWAFNEAIRAAASRFGHEAKFACPPLSAPGSKLVEEGKAPMWCTYVSADGLDLMVFRMRLRPEGGRIEYVGLFETRPTGPLRADGEPPPPPLRPTDPARAQRRAQNPGRAHPLPGPVPLPTDPRISPSKP